MIQTTLKKTMKHSKKLSKKEGIPFNVRFDLYIQQKCIARNEEF